MGIKVMYLQDATHIKIIGAVLIQIHRQVQMHIHIKYVVAHSAQIVHLENLLQGVVRHAESVTALYLKIGLRAKTVQGISRELAKERTVLLRAH
jgi:hypothetical protein